MTLGQLSGGRPARVGRCDEGRQAGSDLVNHLSGQTIRIGNFLVEHYLQPARALVPYGASMNPSRPARLLGLFAMLVTLSAACADTGMSVGGNAAADETVAENLSESAGGVHKELAFDDPQIAEIKKGIESGAITQRDWVAPAETPPNESVNSEQQMADEYWRNLKPTNLQFECGDDSTVSFFGKYGQSTSVIYFVELNQWAHGTYSGGMSTMCPSDELPPGVSKNQVKQLIQDASTKIKPWGDEVTSFDDVVYTGPFTRGDGSTILKFTGYKPELSLVSGIHYDLEKGRWSR